MRFASAIAASKSRHADQLQQRAEVLLSSVDRATSVTSISPGESSVRRFRRSGRISTSERAPRAMQIVLRREQLLRRRGR